MRAAIHYFKKIFNTNDILKVRVIFVKNIYDSWDGSKLMVSTHAFQK